MGRTDSKILASLGTLGALVLGGLLSSCTHTIQIEPSDKPFVVNLNVKIDHDIKVKIEDENRDLLNLEDDVIKGHKKKGKS